MAAWLSGERQAATGDAAASAVIMSGVKGVWSMRLYHVLPNGGADALLLFCGNHAHDV